MKCPDCGKDFTPNSPCQKRCRSCGYVKSLKFQSDRRDKSRPKRKREEPMGYWGEKGYIYYYLHEMNDRNPESQLEPYELGSTSYRLLQGGRP